MLALEDPFARKKAQLDSVKVHCRSLLGLTSSYMRPPADRSGEGGRDAMSLSMHERRILPASRMLPSLEHVP